MARPKLAVGIEPLREELRVVVLDATAPPAVRFARRVSGTDELYRFLRGLPGRIGEIVTTVSLREAAIRTLDLPPTTEENLERAIALEAEAALPLAGDELAISHHVLGMTEQSRVHTLVAAAQHQAVRQLLERVNCMGHVTAKCTITPAALWNLLSARGLLPQSGYVIVARLERSETEVYVFNAAGLIQTAFYNLGTGGGEGWSAPIAAQINRLRQILSFERGLDHGTLLLCGDGAGMLDADLDLASGTGLHTQILALAEHEAEGGALAVAMGCALQAAGAGVVTLNLTPARVAVEREIQQLRQARFSWGTLVGATALSIALVAGALVTQKQKTLERLQTDLAILKNAQRVDAPSPGTLKKTHDAVVEAAENRIPPGRLLAALSSQLPTSVWLTELTYSATTGCVIRGASTDQTGPQRAQIALLRQRLFDEVSLDYRTEEEVNSIPVWGFQMSCKLRPVEKKRSATARTAGARR